LLVLAQADRLQGRLEQAALPFRLDRLAVARGRGELLRGEMQRCMEALQVLGLPGPSRRA
jgi:hypothetical protein